MTNPVERPDKRGTAIAFAPPPSVARLPGAAKCVAVAGFSLLLLEAWRRSRHGATNGMGDRHIKLSHNSLEQQLIDSERRCLFLFENNPMPMWVYDVETLQFLAVNDAALERYGFSCDEFLALRFSDIVETATGQNGSDNSNPQWRVRRRDGTLSHIEASTHELRLEGRMARMVVAKEIYPAEARLSAFSMLGHRLCSARRQREAIQIILDTADQFFGWDACTFDSYSAAQDLVQPIVVIDRIEGLRREVEPVIRNSRPTARMRDIIKNGARLILREYPVQMSADSVPMGDQNRPSASIMYVPVRSGETVIGLLSIQSYKIHAYSEADLQLLQALADHGAGALERIQAEEEIKRLNAQLEDRIAERTAALRETVRELEAFSYSVSHDMRAPLRAMQGYARKLLDEYPGKIVDNTAADYLARISRAAVRLDHLIRDVLTYTKVLRSEAPLRAVDLEHLIRDVVEAYPEWQSPKALIEIQSPIPRVVGNEALLMQCISNLLSNSTKFVDPGVTPKICIRADLTRSGVRIWFEDNGLGIAPENHERIFRMFERVYPASRFEGTGIGLTIVRKAVERMNGEVGFDSEYGKGSQFWIQLQGAERVV